MSAPTSMTTIDALRWALGRVDPHSRGDYFHAAEKALRTAEAEAALAGNLAANLRTSDDDRPAGTRALCIGCRAPGLTLLGYLAAHTAVPADRAREYARKTYECPDGSPTFVQVSRALAALRIFEADAMTKALAALESH
jgi:hypothetical protein